jgi:hypothetical protein
VDGDELPDTDYASIYGHAALHLRTLAGLQAVMRHQEAMCARLDALIAQSHETLGALDQLITEHGGEQG